MKGRRIVITGGAAGIGLTLARRFQEIGFRVAICDVNPDAVGHLKANCPDVLAMEADVADEFQMNAFLNKVEEEWGGADVVCANAGTGGPAGKIEDLGYDDWTKCVGINLFGAFLACRWAARVMKKQGTGLILLTASTSGLNGVPYRSPYVSAKWGVIGLMKTLAMELGPSGVRVNAIAPGAVKGERMEKVVQMEAAARGMDEDVIRSMYAKGSSLREWVAADDIANMAIFLASPAASMVSGQVIAVDGHTESMVP